MGQNKIADGFRSCPLLWAASPWGAQGRSDVGRMSGRQEHTLPALEKF